MNQPTSFPAPPPAPQPIVVVRHRRRWPWVLGIVGVVIIAVVATRGDKESGTVSDTANAGSNAGAGSAPGAAPGPVPDVETAAGNPTFGQTWTSPDGLAISVGAPKEFTPSEYSFGTGDETSTHLSFEVTVVNGTDEDFEPSLMSINLQAGNKEAEQVYDSANDMGGGPSTVLLPGREVVFTVGFTVDRTDDLVMEVSASIFGDSVIFTS